MRYLQLFEQHILEEIEFNPSMPNFEATFPEADVPDDVRDNCFISFNKKNKKIKHPYLSLPAGYTCPFAVDCKTKAYEDPNQPGRWKIQDYGQFRCYAASAEARYPETRVQHWTNYNLLKAQKTKDKTVSLILRSIMHEYTTNDRKKNKVFNLKIMRIHESGDFFNQAYFDAWVDVAKALPNVTFYAYTKSLRFWVKRLGDIPENLKLNASKGGKDDKLIDEHGLKYVQIVHDPEEAEALGLPIDVDDTHAWKSDESFALLIHGSQPAKTSWSKSSYANRQRIKDMGGYQESLQAALDLS